MEVAVMSLQTLPPIPFLQNSLHFYDPVLRSAGNQIVLMLF